MPMIRIPQEHWGDVWFALVSAGPISRVSQEPIYFVSEKPYSSLAPSACSSAITRP